MYASSTYVCIPCCSHFRAQKDKRPAEEQQQLGNDAKRAATGAAGAAATAAAVATPAAQPTAAQPYAAQPSYGTAANGIAAVPYGQPTPASAAAAPSFPALQSPPFLLQQPQQLPYNGAPPPFLVLPPGTAVPQGLVAAPPAAGATDAGANPSASAAGAAAAPAAAAPAMDPYQEGCRQQAAAQAAAIVTAAAQVAAGLPPVVAPPTDIADLDTVRQDEQLVYLDVSVDGLHE